ncbi:MAG TPA: VOC family protein [Ktedonobacterales bacterium]
MPSSIDHVILAGPDLDKLEQTFTRLGFHVTGGGRHPHLGTRNRIIVLDDSYIELLAIADPERASPALIGFIAQGGGWLGYALQTTDIVAETNAMRARGVDARGPTAGSLTAPDGSSRGWRVTTIGSEDIWQASFPVPFLIQHNTTGETHRMELAGAGGIAPHPNGASHLMSARHICRDVAEVAGRFQAAYNLPGGVTRTEYEGVENVSANFALQSGEAIQLFQGPNNTMSVRVRVTRPAIIEELHWHTTVSTTRTTRTLVIPLPGLHAELECTSSR